jgi:hypothetical protein
MQEPQRFPCFPVKRNISRPSIKIASRDEMHRLLVRRDRYRELEAYFGGILSLRCTSSPAIRMRLGLSKERLLLRD